MAVGSLEGIGYARSLVCEVALAGRYREVRRTTEALAAPLSAEDCVVQTMPDVSPTKWHLAHTSWFFETFVLSRAVDGYGPFHPRFSYLFNSYYDAVGARHCRHRRGILSRPPLHEVEAYRAHVDDVLLRWLERGEASPELAALVELGLHHEQQHQELILTDIKHVLWSNPMKPVYRKTVRAAQRRSPSPSVWRSYEGGLCWIGSDGSEFSFDNEGPRHRAYLEPFELASRLVTCGEFLEFVQAGGYRDPRLWLSDGWAAVQAGGWEAPLYWELQDGEARCFTLHGARPVDRDEPVCHVSFYEADAFARWAGARLPTELEWEVAAAETAVEGNLLESERFHPAPASGDGALLQLFGDVWEWTGSPYTPYPGYRAPAGAIGEYNGKFMSSQMVLRGGSCATPRSHIRSTYRNFFPPEARWQLSGIRLARVVSP